MKSKDGTYRVVALVGLVVSILALTMGFAAFTTSLTISSSAEVTPASSTLNVVFSSDPDSNVTNAPAISYNPVSGVPTASAASLNGTTVTGIRARFNAHDQSVTYSFYARNNSSYTAYLTGITFKPITQNGSDFKTCAPKTGVTNPATGDLSGACSDISLTVSMGDVSSTHPVSLSSSDVASLQANDKIINSGDYKVVTVTIAYGHAYPIPDGDFTATFGDIELSFSSVAPSA